MQPWTLCVHFEPRLPAKSLRENSHLPGHNAAFSTITCEVPDPRNGAHSAASTDQIRSLPNSLSCPCRHDHAHHTAARPGTRLFGEVPGIGMPGCPQSQKACATIRVGVTRETRGSLGGRCATTTGNPRSGARSRPSSISVASLASRADCDRRLHSVGRIALAATCSFGVSGSGSVLLLPGSDFRFPVSAVGEDVRLSVT